MLRAATELRNFKGTTDNLSVKNFSNLWLEYSVTFHFMKQSRRTYNSFGNAASYFADKIYKAVSQGLLKFMA
jgi:hypothetical protein